MITLTFKNLGLDDEKKARIEKTLQYFLYCRVTNDKLVITLSNNDRENVFLYATFFCVKYNLSGAEFDVKYPAFTKYFDVKTDDKGEEICYAVMSMPEKIKQLRLSLSPYIDMKEFEKQNKKWKKENTI